MKPIRVMVVDDSAVVRQALSALLAQEADMLVSYAVGDPVIAMERMRQQWPDVVLLDVETPRMNGLALLRRLMAEHPTPVVACAADGHDGASQSHDAMAAGAVAVVRLPRQDLRHALADAYPALVAALRHAAGAPRHAAGAQPSLAPRTEGARVVALGTSTGGTQALEKVLSELAPAVPGIVIVQHMPEQFTGAFAHRLDGLCRISVKEARHGDAVLPGQALIAPGGRHMLLQRRRSEYFVEVVEGPHVNRHRPSVDVLFRSVASSAGANALGIIMTGMGDDGALGLLEMRQAGARTLAQDEQSCVVYGMPKEAVKRGAAERSVPLNAISREIMQYGGASGESE